MRDRALRKENRRPILWFGGSGLPGGEERHELDSLGHPLHWEPASPESAGKLIELEPLLVIVEAETINKSVKELLLSLQELKGSSEFAVFLLHERELDQDAGLADGAFLRNREFVLQVGAALSAFSAMLRTGPGAKPDHRKKRHDREEIRRLRELVLRDDLTCLYNLRYFNSALETEHSRAMRFGRRYSLLFMDLDGLREVNSRHGHLAGGNVLKQLGEYLNTKLRSIDISARVGGDEFVVICPETPKQSARVIAERIRHGIEALKIHEKDTSQGITASVGVASYPDDGASPKEVLRRADQALYEAKDWGKNCVCCWGDFPADPQAKLFSGSVHSNQDEEDTGTSGD